MTKAQQALIDRLPTKKPERLTEREWRVLVAHVRHGVPYARIALQLGVSRARTQQMGERAVWKLERLAS